MTPGTEETKMVEKSREVDAPQDDLRMFVQDRLRPFIRAFDAENRNNRLSAALVEGLGGILQNLIVGIIQEQRKSEDRAPLHDEFEKLIKEHQE